MEKYIQQLYEIEQDLMTVRYWLERVGTQRNAVSTVADFIKTYDGLSDSLDKVFSEIIKNHGLEKIRL